MNIPIIIVGGGPIGITVAIEAKKMGIDALIIEKGMLVNTIYNFPSNMTFFSTSKKLEIGEVPFISHLDKPSRREALEYFRRVFEVWDLNANLYESVLDVKKNDDAFLLTTNKGSYTCDNIVLATGFHDIPHLLNIPGESLDKVRHYYDDAHPYVGQKVVVIGSANSACDVALELYQKGADVTMVVRSEKLNDRVKYWIKPNIENRIKEGSIKSFFSSQVVKIEENKLVIKNNNTGQLTEIENNFVLAMTGFEPNYDLLNRFGIEIEKDDYKTPFYTDENHESNQKGIYIAGVLCGGMKTNKYFIENAKDHAEKIIQHINKKEKI